MVVPASPGVCLLRYALLSETIDLTLRDQLAVTYRYTMQSQLLRAKSFVSLVLSSLIVEYMPSYHRRFYSLLGS